MRIFRGIFMLALLCFITLSACRGAPDSTPQGGNMSTQSQSAAPDAAYTAAAETIAAQLTEMSIPATQPSSVQDTPGSAASPTSAEAKIPDSGSTLPDTTTPQPSNTPLPSDTPTPTNTPTITSTPLPTNTPTITPVSANDPRASLGTPNGQDTFASAGNWPLYNDEHVQMEVKEDGLYMTSVNADKWESWMLTESNLENFYLEVTATPGECAGWDRYGLLARSQDASHTYLFGFTCDGKYSLRIWDGLQFTMLVQWTPSEYILAGAGQTNRLGFKAVGSTLSIYANGVLLAEVEDDTYSSGTYGLSSSAFTTPGFTVQFSEVSYWNLP